MPSVCWRKRPQWGAPGPQSHVALPIVVMLRCSRGSIQGLDPKTWQLVTFSQTAIALLRKARYGPRH